MKWFIFIAAVQKKIWYSTCFSYTQQKYIVHCVYWDFLIQTNKMFRSETFQQTNLTHCQIESHKDFLLKQNSKSLHVGCKSTIHSTTTPEINVNRVSSFELQIESAIVRFPKNVRLVLCFLWKCVILYGNTAPYFWDVYVLFKKKLWTCIE